MKLKEVDVATSELHPFPSVVVHVPDGRAAGSLLKIRLFSDTVTVPVDPVSKVFMTLADAFETKSKPPDRTATGAKASRKFRKVIVPSLAMYSRIVSFVLIPPKILR